MLSHKLKSVVSLMIIRNVLRDTPKTCTLIWIKACFFISQSGIYCLLCLLYWFCSFVKNKSTAS